MATVLVSPQVTYIRIFLVLSLLVRISEAESERVDMTRLLLVNRPSLYCLHEQFIIDSKQKLSDFSKFLFYCQENCKL